MLPLFISSFLFSRKSNKLGYTTIFCIGNSPFIGRSQVSKVVPLRNEIVDGVVVITYIDSINAMVITKLQCIAALTDPATNILSVTIP